MKRRASEGESKRDIAVIMILLSVIPALVMNYVGYRFDKFRGRDG